MGEFEFNREFNRPRWLAQRKAQRKAQPVAQRRNQRHPGAAVSQTMMLALKQPNRDSG
ncbi:hypothetical protein [Paraburkholderia sp.]|uniref:hypothetical protein n=1 Tax=Paraburkholderia sp. TaxID=1926495 RepID=UPI0025F2CAF9|nr:hypothetical protein [Paraburkholderia sp.]